MKPRKGATSVVRIDILEWLDSDGFENFIFGTRGPFGSLAEAGAAWERDRTAVWELWGRFLHEQRRRGPDLHPPLAAVVHDGIGDAASRVDWPKKGTDPRVAVDACDADLASIEAFGSARPREARAIEGPLDLYVAQILWLRSAALRAGDDYALGDRLVWGPAPTNNEIESDDVLWKDEL